MDFIQVFPDTDRLLIVRSSNVLQNFISLFTLDLRRFGRHEVST